MKANSYPYKKRRLNSYRKNRSSVVGSLARTRRIRRVKPGFTRTVGYYGRFNKEGAEEKFLDTQIDISNITNAYVVATNQITSLNVIPQGNGQSEREGRKVWLKSIQFRLRITTDPAIAAAPLNMIRIMVVMDTQTNGAAYTGAQLLQQFFVYGYRNIENTQRLKVLYDKVIVLNNVSINTAATTILAVNRFVKWYHKCNIPIDYDSTANTGALATIRSNNISILYCPSSTTDSIDIFGYARVRYTESQF